MPIYTRTGDKGQTSLSDGTRVLKSSKRIKTNGTLDELNCAVGLSIAFLSKPQLKFIKKELENIQTDLFVIGSNLAGQKSQPLDGIENRARDFEKMIDFLTKQLSPLKNFILPGGGKAGSHLHICRAAARRSERAVVELMQSETVSTIILVYLNRVSDLFFTIARYVNFVEKKKETKWIRKR